MKKSVSLVLVIIILCLILLCGGGVYAYFFTDIFKSDKELFFKYLLNNKTISEVLSFDELESYGKKQETTPYTSSGYIKANNNFDLALMDSDTADLIKDSEITFTSDVDKTNSYNYTQIDFNYTNEESLNLEYVNTNNYYGIKIESILKKFLTVENSNLKEFATKLGLSETYAEYIPDEINFDELTSQENLFTEDEISEIKTTYYNILYENITDSMFSNSTSEDGQTIYNLRIDKTQAVNIIVKLLEQLENDETIFNKLKEYAINNSGLTETEADEYITKIKQEIQTYIDDLNESTSSEETSNDEVVNETFAVISVYVQNKKMTKIELSFEKAEISISAADNAITIEIVQSEEANEEEITNTNVDDDTNTDISITLQKATTDDTFEYRLVCNANEDTIIDFQIDYTGLSGLTQVEEKSIITLDFGEGYELGYTYSNTKSFTEALEDYVDESKLYILNEQNDPLKTIETFSELLIELNDDQMKTLGVKTNPMIYYIPAVIPAAMTCCLATGDVSNVMVAGEVGTVGVAIGLLVYKGNLTTGNNNDLDSLTSETILNGAKDICDNIASQESIPEDIESVDDIDQYIVDEINNYDWANYSTDITCTAMFASGESTIEIVSLIDGTVLRGTMYYGTIEWEEINEEEEDDENNDEDENENEDEDEDTENTVDDDENLVDEDTSDDNETEGNSRTEIEF